MPFRTSYQFETAVLGSHSSGDELVRQFWDEEADFSDDVTALIEEAGPEYPDTRIGESLHSMVKAELDRHGINTRGLIFRSAINTKVDARHLADAFFHLPSAYRFPVMVDLFNIYPSDMLSLRDLWVREWVGESAESCYTDMDLQTDLFHYNRGLFVWMNNNGILGNTFVAPDLGKFRRRINKIPRNVVGAPSSMDFRQYADRGRPKDLFMLTPLYVETSEKRKEFAKLVAGYLIKVSGHEMALLSH